MTIVDRADASADPLAAREKARTPGSGRAVILRAPLGVS